MMGKKGFWEHDKVEIVLCTPKFLDKLIMNPKVKTTEGEGVGARSLARSTLEIKGHAKL
jgi:hypothetical protein